MRGTGWIVLTLAAPVALQGQDASRILVQPQGEKPLLYAPIPEDEAKAAMDREPQPTPETLPGVGR